MAFNLRPRTKIDYQTLNEGEPIKLNKTCTSLKPRLLEQPFYVERIIWRKQTKKSVSVLHIFTIKIKTCIM